jgi:RND family efflux transporter MFP subunit
MSRIERTGLAPVLLLLALVLILAPGCDPVATDEAAGEEGEAVEAGEADASSSAEDEAEEEAEEDAEEEKEPARRRERSTSVSAAPVLRGDLVVPVIAEGSIRARNTAAVKFEIGGRLDELLVREGQWVRRGQPLARIDDREYQLALQDADARFLQGLAQLAVEEEGYEGRRAERTLEEKRAELARMEQAGEISREERRDRELELGMEAVREGAYRRELMELRSGLHAARNDAARAKLDIERCTVLAPFSGVITGLDLTAGERVQVGETLCRLVDNVNVEAAVGVLESDLGAVQAGRKAFLTIPALGERLPVQVDVVSPDVDESSRTCQVLLRLRSRDGRVKPGMFVRAAIAGQRLEDRLLVPREAIVTRDGRPVLFRVEDGRAKWVYVQLGARNDHLVEIARIDQGGPLDPGTPVIVDNHLTMTHDAKVKVKTMVEIDDPWIEAADDSEQG